MPKRLPAPETMQLRGERNVSSKHRALTRPEAVQPVEANPPLGDRPPAELEGAGFEAERRWWRRIVRVVGLLPILRQTDMPVLVLLCEALARQERLFGECRGQEVLPAEICPLTGKVTPSRVNPAYTVAQRERTQAVALLDKFGMNPTARGRIMLDIAATMNHAQQAKQTQSERQQAGAEFLREVGKA